MFLFIFVRLAEWSKAVGLSPITFESTGSNPVPNNNFSHFLLLNTKTGNRVR